MCKERGLAEQCDGTGKKDEDESAREEIAEKSFLWENSARPDLKGTSNILTAQMVIERTTTVALYI